MVDDITLLPSVIKPGMKYENGLLIFDSDKVIEDETVSDDIRTMKIVQAVANNIDKNIHVTYDVPSLHDDKMVPILDVKVIINEVGKIDYKFFKKPCANRLGTLKDSAYSMKNKITILTQECFRRLHNTSESMDDKINGDILSGYMVDLKPSGYNEKERETIFKGGIQTSHVHL